MKQFCVLLSFFFALTAKGQELYVFTEPASNMPARSISIRVRSEFMAPQPWHNLPMHRLMPEIMFGLNKKWMLHTGLTFADMHTANFGWESIYGYLKYRFLSKDEIHQHFRMAAFIEATYSRAPFHQDEANLGGDKSGVQAGIIATQLWNKLAISATLSHTQILDESRNSKNVIYVPSRIYQVMNYSLSAGYLLLPRSYTDYKQTNLNIYLEFLGQQSLDRKAYFIDMAPALQLIFNSNTKLNVGYRFQLDGTMQRMAKTSWLISIERTFLNALGKSK
ncbi:MAG: hypothetical protein E6H09_00965 [Bacteroidetes bacterium]|nr:MAG: hypothetical protein E6H09_00965 [Bacteroidota bacterium]